MQCQQVLLDAFIAVEEVGGKFHVEVRQLCSVWLVGVATLSSGVFALLGTVVRWYWFLSTTLYHGTHTLTTVTYLYQRLSVNHHARRQCFEPWKASVS